MHMMAPDGRCKAFDSQANGFVRGEGCGVVILKRLSDALSAGDTILAVIRGSAINQDGHTNGLTAPNGLSQQQVIDRALENAGVQPSEISYIEAHGTGTSLGDVIELEAIAAIFGRAQQDRNTCFLGSAKTNIGHLEGAAGIAGPHQDGPVAAEKDDSTRGSFQEPLIRISRSSKRRSECRLDCSHGTWTKSDWQVSVPLAGPERTSMSCWRRRHRNRLFMRARHLKNTRIYF